MERTITVRVREGLHARPATRFVKLAKSFASDVEIVKSGKSASAKSSVKLMLLSVMENDEVTLRVKGEDEAAALESLRRYLENPDAGLDDEGPAAATQTSAIASSENSQFSANSLKGIAASEGVGLGPVFAYFPEEIVADNLKISGPGTAAEINKLEIAIAAVRHNMQGSIDDKSISAAERGIIQALSEIVADDAMLGDMFAAIESGHSALSAVLATSARTAEDFSKMADPYLKARADDLRAVGRQIALSLLGKKDTDLSKVPAGAILVADDVGAFELTRAPLKKIAGIICARGSVTSHIAIIARSHSVPAVLGLGDATRGLIDAKLVGLDGKSGEVVVDPDQAIQAEFAKRKAAAQSEHEALKVYKAFQPQRADGKIIEVAANIGSPDEITAALDAGAMGVGLFRTELLFMQQKELPSEEIQFEIYERVAKAFKPHSVIVRTLDIGGDKPVAGIEFPHEENPFLGWRGVRMCLDRPDVFKPQLRALLRAAVEGNIKVMVPMIVDAAELRAVKALIKICADELKAEGKPYAEFALGVMIETPAAVMVADDLAKDASFFSIGTNDLTQYVMAADRLNPRLAKLNDVTHPAVMRAIAMTAEAGNRAGIMVGMCGEAAGRVDLIPRFIEMGLTELSMSPSMIPRAKEKLAQMTATAP
ncbi:MAG: phosphoenolpyruvate--protein phosphotransferase [Aestuariivirga sp.]